MEYKVLIENIARELNLSTDVVDKTYKAYWRFIRDTIQDLPLKELNSSEDYQKLRTNFNIPSLGKLCATYQHCVGIKKRFEYIRRLKEKL